MPDKRAHRGAHPDDARLFAGEAVPTLREAVRDLSWLQTRGYAQPSAVKIVGDRYSLDQRKRVAVMRSACPDEAMMARIARRIPAESLSGKPVLIDGYNVLTTVEAALAGGVILAARDSCFRDIASMHGTFRKVEETLPALRLVGGTMQELGAPEAAWYLDAPVSNSGRLREIILNVALERGWRWRVEVVPNPDAVLAACSEAIIASADSVILDRCGPWANLAREVVTRRVPTAHVIELA